MAKSIDLYIDQGSTFTSILKVTDADGQAFDLTGYTSLCQMRRSYYSRTAIQITSTISDEENGELTLSLTREQTRNIPPARYVYDVVITDVADNRTRVFEGLITVNPGVTDRENTILVDPSQDDDWGTI